MKLTTISILMALVLSLMPSASKAACDFGPDTCLVGWVWRDAFPGDHVCVTGDVRAQAAEDNRLAFSRLVFISLPPLPIIVRCGFGFVRRQASPTDGVCVTEQTKNQAAFDNSQASFRRDEQCALLEKPECKSGGFETLYGYDDAGNLKDILQGGVSKPPQPAAPIITSFGGEFGSCPASVQIAHSDPNLPIYYTTDGTFPSSSSSRYSGIIPISKNGVRTLHAIAQSTCSISTLATANYSCQPPVKKVYPPQTPTIFHQATIFPAGYEDIVYENVSLPVGCRVTVAITIVDKNGLYVASTDVPGQKATGNNADASYERLGPTDASLALRVKSSHGFFTAVRYNLNYSLRGNSCPDSLPPFSYRQVK